MAAGCPPCWRLSFSLGPSVPAGDVQHPPCSPIPRTCAPLQLLLLPLKAHLGSLVLLLLFATSPLHARGVSSSEAALGLSTPSSYPGRDGPMATAAPFVFKALTTLRERPQGYDPSPLCRVAVGMNYLRFIRRTRTAFCTPDARRASARSVAESGGEEGGADWDDGAPADEEEEDLPPTKSSADCYYAPFSRVGDAAASSVSLCRTRNVVLDSCAFYKRKRPGVLDKKFPLPTRGAVKLACELQDLGGIYAREPLMDTVQTEVWFKEAKRVRRTGWGRGRRRMGGGRRGGGEEGCVCTWGKGRARGWEGGRQWEGRLRMECKAWGAGWWVGGQ